MKIKPQMMAVKVLDLIRLCARLVLDEGVDVLFLGFVFLIDGSDWGTVADVLLVDVEVEDLAAEVQVEGADAAGTKT